MEKNDPHGSLSRRRAIQIGGGSILAVTATAGALDATTGSALAAEPHSGRTKAGGGDTT